MSGLPIAVRSNPGKYSYSGSTRLINAYAEQQGADAKQPMAVMPCYGMKLFASVTDTPSRGTIFLDDLDVAYVFHSTGVWKLEESGTSTRIGTIPGNDIVQLSRNQATNPQISVRCSAGDYYIQSDSVTKIVDEDLPTPVSQDQVGGYTAYGIRDRRVFLSGLNECQTVDGLDFATAEQSADPLVRVKGDRGDLWVFKEKSVEPWRNTGNADFPFEPIPGSTIQKGLLATNAVVDGDNTLMFPGHDNIVYRLNGYTPQRISTHSIERDLQGDASPSSMIGFTHYAEGHTFATWTGDTYTRSYDAATQTWHDRESYLLGKWRARFPFRAWGKTIVGDQLSGNYYELDKDTFDEAGDPLIWGMDTPTLNAFPSGGIIDAVYLDVQTGVGNLTGDGFDPILMLDWTIDGGKTWRGARQLKLGKWGDYVRIRTNRLGRFGEKGVSFRIRVSDPVIRSIIAIDVSVRPIKK